MTFNPFCEKPKFLDSIKPNSGADDLLFNDFPFILAINKPVGITSFDCIRKMRSRIFAVLGRGKGRRKLKIGHFGTLDPFADGVLLVGTGKAMRMMGLIQEGLKKNYRARCEFGKQTITGDLDGEVINSWESDKFDGLAPRLFEDLVEKSKEFIGDYWQVPPYYSAVKHEGKPLYEYARQGVFIEKEPVLRQVHELSIAPLKQEFSYELNCCVSNGTYIRCLWQDMLSDYQKMGYLQELTRVSYGSVAYQDCQNLDDFCSGDSKEFSYLTPWQLLDFPTLELSSNQAGALLQGAFLECADGQVDQHYWMRFDGEVVALGIGMLQESSVKVKAKVNFY
jgi:tRNA pseudouridine55 synthase